MKVVHHPSEFDRASRRCCIAIGVFDGVHRGHQQLLARARADADTVNGICVAITFDVHPNAVVHPEENPPLIYPLYRKLETLAASGVDATWLITFDRAFSRRTAEDFAASLPRDFAPLHSLSVGGLFSFGHRRQGNLSLLQRCGAEAGYLVHGIAPVRHGDQPVSSTRIREAIQRGDLSTASQMLGRPYVLTGGVESGARLGSRLGFPTANLRCAGLVLPPSGVYAAWAIIDERRLPSVVNIGLRPTVAHGETTPRVEAHLLDFTGDLYGRQLDLCLAERLRPEQRFTGVDALRDQIEKDVAKARQVLA